MAKAPTPSAETQKNEEAEAPAQVLEANEAAVEAAQIASGGHPAPLTADKDGKIEVETVGQFMLVDPISGDQIEAEGPSKVKLTSFIQQRYEAGQLKLA